MSAAMSQMEGQLAALSAKLDQMGAVPPAPQPVTEAPTTSARVAAAAGPSMSKPTRRKMTARRRAPEDKRWKQVQSRLDAQQKQLDATQDEVAKTRTDMEGSLNSTRDELNGSIAKNHDELVALEKRGERSYFEFELAKSKQFQHLGPLMLSLRKADTKHKSYDLAMIVDDNQISKKRVDLYEPIWLHAGDDLQPVQVVVNEIDKDHVRGYVSAPKYSQRRQTAATAPSANAPASNLNPASIPAVPQQSPNP
jgi:septal ring factor EnvC (AmiA/AmiB activator)